MSVPFVRLLNLVELTRFFHSGMRRGFKNRANLMLCSKSSVGLILGTVFWISLLFSLFIQIRKSFLDKVPTPLDEARHNQVIGGVPLLFLLKQWSFFLQVGCILAV